MIRGSGELQYELQLKYDDASLLSSKLILSRPSPKHNLVFITSHNMHTKSGRRVIMCVFSRQASRFALWPPTNVTPVEERQLSFRSISGHDASGWWPAVRCGLWTLLLTG
jgi:hypothetical protein